MGLDMYAWSVNKDEAKQYNTDLPIHEDMDKQNIHYWRKHHDLHGWMHRLYKSKGGESLEFNLNSVRLTMSDLEDLEKDLKAEYLPQTTGFFFGNNPPDEDSLKDDLEFIKKAKEEIYAGRVVFYDSWW